MSEDDKFNAVEEFAYGLRSLLRDIHSKYPEMDDDLLARMQDKTSLFSPWMWADGPGEYEAERSEKTDSGCHCQYPCDCGVIE